MEWSFWEKDNKHGITTQQGPQDSACICISWPLPDTWVSPNAVSVFHLPSVIHTEQTVLIPLGYANWDLLEIRAGTAVTYRGTPAQGCNAVGFCYGPSNPTRSPTLGEKCQQLHFTYWHIYIWYFIYIPKQKIARNILETLSYCNSCLYTKLWTNLQQNHFKVYFFSCNFLLACLV